jgi:hypothetical protein
MPGILQVVIELKSENNFNVTNDAFPGMEKCC